MDKPEAPRLDIRFKTSLDLIPWPRRMAQDPSLLCGTFLRALQGHQTFTEKKWMGDLDRFTGYIALSILHIIESLHIFL